MNKNRSSRRDLMREELAHLAARLMAKDGITDYAFAKRKAARQMGATETQHMPSNEEIDVALQTFRALYESESHPLVLQQLRQQALAVMKVLKPFHPYLTGSVLNGSAGEQSDINLIIYTDDEKSAMMFLLKHNIPFTAAEWRVHSGGKERAVPCFTWYTASNVLVSLAVLPENARHSGNRKPATCVDEEALATLLEKNTAAEEVMLHEDTMRR